MSTEFDAEQYRHDSGEHWDEAAPGWVRRQAMVRDFGAPVSHWMVEAIAPQSGHRVLELAAGIGETGLLAAELVAPAGGVVISDQSQAMLDGARDRAGELGLTNVEFQVLGAEWIDLAVASVDAVLCRWGYMLMADPSAALLETRRVLRSGGRIAFAVWDALNVNPWAMLPAAELIERGLMAPATGDGPGPFAMADPDRVYSLLVATGFADTQIQALDLRQRHASFEDFWQTTLDISRQFHDVVLDQPESQIASIRDAVAERLAPYTAEDGSLSIPGRSLVAAASA
jgi:ubiquinone/menaquinone biosynthesis C-methylase UbiE